MHVVSKPVFKLRFLVLPALLATALVLTIGRDGSSRLESLDGYTMGTRYHLQLVGVPEGLSRESLVTEIDDLLRYLDREVFSTYVQESELSRFNRHPVGSAFAASPELLEVMSLALEIAANTDGAFDPTIGALVDLWGFGPGRNQGKGIVPSTTEIQSLLANTSFQHLLFESAAGNLRKTRDLKIDLSGIAKGYAVDVLGSYLDGLGVENYFLDIGGELKMKGNKPGQRGWVPAIEAPENGTSAVYEILFSRGETLALAGSGDYRNYFEADGERYSHEIDPCNGQPVSHGLVAVYVIDASAARADALATAYMIMGLSKARSHAAQIGQAAYFIVNTGPGFADYTTDAFARYLEEPATNGP